MQKSKLHILSTRPLTKELVTAALEHNIEIDEVSFIETSPVNDFSILQKIKVLAGQPITAVFTSMNAVQAVAEQIHQNPNWTIYSIGTATQKLVEEKLKVKIKGTAPYAEGLADVMIKDAVKKAYFFCGNIRRDVLPHKLKQAGIRLEEIVVYETTETAKQLSKPYDGILFYSPSAVQSFFTANTVNKNTLFFAIGATTAGAIQQYTNNNVTVAETLGKEDLVKKMIWHFSQQKKD